MSEKKKLVMFDFSGVLINTSITGNTAIPDVLKKNISALASQGFILAIISSMPLDTIQRILEEDKISGNFQYVSGYSLLSSKTKKIIALIEKTEVNKENAVYVTDTLHDIK